MMCALAGGISIAIRRRWKGVPLGMVLFLVFVIVKVIELASAIVI
jgi:hypothetical protein